MVFDRSLFIRGLILALVVVVTAAGAADSPTSAQLGRALDGLPSTVAPSGILLDRTVILSNLTRHDGRDGSPAVDVAGLRQMLLEMHRASLVSRDWPTPTDLRRAARLGRQTNEVPLALLNLAYHRLRDDAVAPGRLQLDGNRLVLAPGTSADTVSRAGRLVAAAPLLERILGGRVVRYRMAADLVVTDTPLRNLSIDLDDGGGARPLVPDETIVAHYRTTGVKTLTVRATLADGSSVTSRSTLRVDTLDAPPYTEAWPITASISHDGEAGTGTAYVYLADGHTQLTDPVVIVEGFDLDNSLGWPELYELLNQENLLEDLRANGRDAVVLDFTESTDPIQRNAFVLTELLGTIDAVLPTGRAYPLVGASMGGLVGRYALCYLEANGIAHRVHTFLSFDGAQHGANIPLGLQYWLSFFQGESEEAAYLLSRLDTTAARQLLLYHHTDPPGATGQADPLHDALTVQLAGLGDWPAGPRLVAVANGSGATQNQGFDAGAQIVRWEYTSLLVDITGNIWAVPDQSSHIIFDGEIDLIWPLPDTYQTVTVAETRPLDSGPGGWRPSVAQLDTTDVPYGDVEGLHPNHAFIPTISALALDTDDVFFDVAGASDPLALTPFDAIYHPASNEEHVLITPDNKVWILAELDQATTAAPDPVTALAAAPLLYGAEPNPFNPHTSIHYSIPSAGRVTLEVIDLRGRRIRRLVNDALDAGHHRTVWDGRDRRSRPLAAGVYLVRLTHADHVVTNRITLAK